MPTSVRGNEPAPRLTLQGTPDRRRVGAPAPRGDARGFTIIELLIVVALIAVASSVVSLALRDPAATQLEQEAVRLSALLESARAEARASGLPVRWEITQADDESGQIQQAGFRFVGLPPEAKLPNRWMSSEVSAQIVGAGAVQLGPEPLIAAQRIVLHLQQQQISVATDGLAPFAPVHDADAARP